MWYSGILDNEIHLQLGALFSFSPLYQNRKFYRTAERQIFGMGFITRIHLFYCINSDRFLYSTRSLDSYALGPYPNLLYQRTKFSKETAFGRRFREDTLKAIHMAQLIK
jgi:hypothetical protein